MSNQNPNQNYPANNPYQQPNPSGFNQEYNTNGYSNSPNPQATPAYPPNQNIPNQHTQNYTQNYQTVQPQPIYSNVPRGQSEMNIPQASKATQGLGVASAIDYVELKKPKISLFAGKKWLVIAGIAGLVILCLVGALFLLLRKASTGVVDPLRVAGTCAKDTRLTWWLPNQSAVSAANFNQIIADFNTANKTNLSIDIQNRDYDPYKYYSGILNAMAEGSGPDLFAIRNDDLPAYVNYLTPISTFDVNKISTYKSQFADVVYAETVYQDKLYAVTTYVDNLQLFYNKQILDQKGIAQPASTWDELAGQVSKLSKVNNNKFDLSAVSLGIGGIAGDKPSNIAYHESIIPTLIIQYGGSIYNEQTNTVDFKVTGNSDTNNPFIQAVKYYASFSDNSSPNYSWNESMDNNIDVFAQNRLAYIVGYKELESTLNEKRQGLDYQIAKLPQKDSSKPATLARYFMTGMSRSLSGTDTASVNKRVCAESFLTYLTTKPAQEKFASLSSMPSARRDVIAAQQSGDQKIKIFADGALYATTYYKPDVINTELIWTNMLKDIVYNRAKLVDIVVKASTNYSSVVNAKPQVRMK